jgi:drug/metabolite transporter (DMT)-like permease
MVGHLSRTTILRYTFSSGAVVALVVSGIVGFSAPMFEGGLKVTPLLVLAFVLIFPTVITYFLIPVGLKYLSSTVVAIYGYVTLIVASLVSFITGVDRFEPVILLSLLLIGVSIYLVGVGDKKESAVKPG